MIDTLRSFGLIVEVIDYFDDRDRHCTNGKVVRGTFLCTKKNNLVDEFPHHYWGGGRHRNWQK
jgi:hypothetical protein